MTCYSLLVSSVNVFPFQGRHSGLDPESSLFNLDSCFRRNDVLIIVNLLLRHYTSYY